MDKEGFVNSGAQKVPHRLEVLNKNFETSEHLKRFLQKSILELVHCKGNALRLTCEKETLKVSLERQGKCLKYFEIKTYWYEDIYHYVRNRTLAFGELASHDWFSEEKVDFEFYTALRVADELVLCKVKKEKLLKGTQFLTLSDFRALTLGEAALLLGIMDYSRRSFNFVYESEVGVLVAVGQDERRIQMGVASLLSLSGAHYVGDFAHAEVKEFCSQKGKDSLLLVSMKGDDPFSCLSSIAPRSSSAFDSPLLGIVVQGFAKKICSFCSREVVPDAYFLDLLPAYLKPPSGTSFRVGKGCEHCNQTGFTGILGLQSVLPIDNDFMRFWEGGKDEAFLIDYYYSRGVRPLLEDGVRKVMQGKITLQSIYEIVKALPPAYERYFKEKGLNIVEEKKAIALFPTARKDTSEKVQDKSLRSSKVVKSLKPELGDEDVTIVSIENTHSKVRILVVEDDNDQQRILELVLRSHGYEVLLASDGVQALEVLKTNVPELILTDLMMPHMDGKELVSRLKLHEVYRHVPVMVLTVVSDADKEYDLLDVGADDYCEKTIQRKVLLKRIEKLLTRL